MTIANPKPKAKDNNISPVSPDAANSVPPLKPMENNKYRAINPFDAFGISKSLFTILAKTPNRKNKRVGFVRLNVRS